MKRMIIFSLVMFIIPFVVFGQWKIKKTTAFKTDEPVHIDGFLKEQDWNKASEAKNFIQFQPERDKPASLNTVVKIMYDNDFIYFGFLCHDPEPKKIASQISKRDSDLRTDDSIYIMIDTYNDKRNCYYFSTNLLGTQLDGRITENGKTNDNTWDGIWSCECQKTEFGWTAEIAISFSCLKYEPGQNKTWGLGLGRGIPRKLEFSFWTGPKESPYKVSQFGELEHLDLQKAKKKLQVIPHLISKLEEGEKAELNAGVDARYAMSQMVSGHLTINPDFATVEADQEKVNLTRFELHLPEKRNFFLEGSEIYRQRIRLFYSRRISDIYGGAKVYGKAGGYEFSGMTVQTKKDESINESSANFSVFRLKKDVMKSSTIGFLAANKLVNGKNRGTAGIDTSLYFSDTFKFTGQFACSYGENNKSNLAFFLRPSYDSSTFHIHLRYTQIGKYFADNANQVGFVRDDNRRELDSAVRKTFWIKKWGLQRITYDSNYNIYWGLDGTLRSWKIDEGLNFDLKNKFMLGVDHSQEYKLYEKKFRNNRTGVSLGYNTREWQSVRVTYNFGKNYDLDFKLIQGSVNYKITEDFSLSYNVSRLIFDPDPEDESTWIHVIRATQYFTNDLFIKVFYQVNTSIDKRNIQVLFVYRFQPPFGFIQLAYQKGTAAFGEKGEQGHTLFLKVTYMF